MDNLKLLEQQVEQDINPNGAPGSILAQKHQDILKLVLATVGKWTGSPFLAKKNITVFTPGLFSWNGNTLNNINDFTVTVSKKTADLNDVGLILETLVLGDLIQFKDYSGRAVFLVYQSHVAGADVSGNPVYTVTVKGLAENPNYIYQDAEQSAAILSYHKKAVDGTVAISTDAGNSAILGADGKLYVPATTGGIDIKGQFINNDDAIANGLVSGDVFSLPYLVPGGFYPLAVVGDAVVNYLKSLTVNSTQDLTGYPVYLTVYNTAGTDATNTVYLDGQVRADWGDLRILNSGENSIPFGILRREPTFVVLAFSADLLIGDNVFYLKYNVPEVAGNVFKIGTTTDQHYEPGTTFVGRDKALLRMDDFKARMIEYQPDLLLEGGDKVGEVITSQPTRSANMQLISDKHQETATAIGCPYKLWGWGNHDFQFESFAQMLSQYGGKPEMVAGSLYGSWETGDYKFISLDSNYKPADDTHQSNSHVGYGYINNNQLTWLTNELSSSTKPVVVLCHHYLGEADTAKMNLAKEIYHVQNRASVRSILEASGKVILVLQGHTHTTMINVIKGITYGCMVDLNEPAVAEQFYDTPVSNLNGRWGLIEIDKSSKTLRFIQETKQGTLVSKIYEFIVPYKTVFDAEFGDNPEKVFSENYGSQYGKPDILIDATDLYTNDQNFIVAKPASILDNDPILSDRTIKMYGITSSPNWGRLSWPFSPRSSGKARIRMSGLMSSLNFKLFKFMSTSGTSNIAIYFGFRDTGNITTYNGLTDVVVGTYSINQWYEFDFVLDLNAKTYSLKINGATVATNYSFYNTGAWSMDKMETLSSAGNGFVDSMRVEKISANEPVITNISNV